MCHCQRLIIFSFWIYFYHNFKLSPTCFRYYKWMLFYFSIRILKRWMQNKNNFINKIRDILIIYSSNKTNPRMSFLFIWFPSKPCSYCSIDNWFSQLTIFLTISCIHYLLETININYIIQLKLNYLVYWLRSVKGLLEEIIVFVWSLGVYETKLYFFYEVCEIY